MISPKFAALCLGCRFGEAGARPHHVGVGSEGFEIVEEVTLLRSGRDHALDLAHGVDVLELGLLDAPEAVALLEETRFLLHGHFGLCLEIGDVLEHGLEKEEVEADTNKHRQK